MNMPRVKSSFFAAALVTLPLGSVPIASAQAVELVDWSGTDIGIDAGYASGDDDAREINGQRAYAPDFNAGLAAVGFRRQLLFDRVVLGGEAQVGHLNGVASVTRDVTGGSITSGASLGAYGSLALRIGYVIHPRWMLFGKAGVVVAELEATTTQTCLGVDLCGGAQSTTESSASSKSPSWGWALGAGVERRMTERVSGSLAYQFMGFRKELALPRIDGPGWRHDVDVHILSVGLRFRF